MNKFELTYPLLLFKETNPAIRAETKEHNDFYFVTSKSLLNVYENMKILDSQGKIITVKKGKIIGKLGFSFLYLKKMFKIDLEIEEIEEINLIQAQKIIINHVNKNKDFWESIDVDVFLKKINQSKTFEELILLFN